MYLPYHSHDDLPLLLDRLKTYFEENTTKHNWTIHATAFPQHNHLTTTKALQDGGPPRGFRSRKLTGRPVLGRERPPPCVVLVCLRLSVLVWRPRWCSLLVSLSTVHLERPLAPWNRSIPTRVLSLKLALTVILYSSVIFWLGGVGPLVGSFGSLAKRDHLGFVVSAFGGNLAFGERREE